MGMVSVETTGFSQQTLKSHRKWQNMQQDQPKWDMVWHTKISSFEMGYMDK